MNLDLKNYTTLQIGGPAKEIISVKTEQYLTEYSQRLTMNDERFLIIGSGSNLLVSDDGYGGTIIKNEITGLEQHGNNLVVKSGTILQDLVNFANDHGLQGLESLAGIPGTVGGAIYGNAGAYGQTISDHLISVKVISVLSPTSHLNPPTSHFTLLTSDCQFSYRDSIFKKTKDFILEAEFELTPGDSESLKQASSETIKKREEKYPPGIKCPGSFFKNIVASTLPKEILAKIPEDKIVYGKLPAGTLLEMVGAKGDSLRNIEIAPYHANLFINKGNGTAKDFYTLAQKYAQKVYLQFGIKLEPEVQLINLPDFNFLQK